MWLWDAWEIRERIMIDKHEAVRLPEKSFDLHKRKLK
jgi:hypothetical protein